MMLIILLLLIIVDTQYRRSKYNTHINGWMTCPSFSKGCINSYYYDSRQVGYLECIFHKRYNKNTSLLLLEIENVGI